jgi:hypothetical protein
MPRDKNNRNGPPGMREAESPVGKLGLFCPKVQWIGPVAGELPIWHYYQAVLQNNEFLIQFNDLTNLPLPEFLVGGSHHRPWISCCEQDGLRRAMQKAILWQAARRIWGGEDNLYRIHIWRLNNGNGGIKFRWTTTITAFCLKRPIILPNDLLPGSYPSP